MVAQFTAGRLQFDIELAVAVNLTVKDQHIPIGRVAARLLATLRFHDRQAIVGQHQFIPDDNTLFIRTAMRNRPQHVACNLLAVSRPGFGPGGKPRYATHEGGC